MSLRVARWSTGAFFLLFVLAVTWPGMLPFNQVRPLVLGLPFSMFWIALWVFLSFLVLLFLDRVEETERRAGRDDAHHAPGRPGEAQVPDSEGKDAQTPRAERPSGGDGDAGQPPREEGD